MSAFDFEVLEILLNAKPMTDFVCSDLGNFVQRPRPSSSLIVVGAEYCKALEETKESEALLSTTGR
jgi:fatty acid/phospholipid biosynthesis enzyme